MARVNKRQWILAQDQSLAAHEVVELGRKVGVPLTAAYVYVTRHTARKQQEALGALKATAPVASKVRATRVPSKPKGAEPDLRAVFLKLCVRAGTINAQRWLNEIRAAEI